ncbi:MAG: biotin/lipoyl-binding protein [gamma proteobacterium symbiont of Lucinoma myriamae]|nr:biotin/lipoyl-binding protein [gamma proteobacterium symbiont of Lucinoma myriamae]
MNRITMNLLTQKIINKPFNHNAVNWLISIVFLMLSTNILASENSDYEITSPLSGVIKNVYVVSGKMIKKGDVLLEFDDTLINSHLSETQSNIKLAKVNREEAKKEYERAEELYERTVLSDHDLQQAKILLVKADAQYASAKNKLVHAKWDAGHSKLYATFTGKVTRVFSYPGQYVNNQFTAQPLLLIKMDSPQ